MDLGQGEVGCGEVEWFSLPQSKKANAAVETQVAQWSLQMQGRGTTCTGISALISC